MLLQKRPRVADIIPNNEQPRSRLVGVNHEATTYRPNTHLFAFSSEKSTYNPQQSQQNFFGINQAMPQDQRHFIERPQNFIALPQQHFVFQQQRDIINRPQNFEHRSDTLQSQQLQQRTEHPQTSDQQRSVLLQYQQQQLLELQRLLQQQQQQQQERQQQQQQSQQNQAQYFVQYQPLTYIPPQSQKDETVQNKGLQEDQQIREQLSKTHNRFGHVGGYLPFSG